MIHRSKSNMCFLNSLKYHYTITKTRVANWLGLALPKHPQKSGVNQMQSSPFFRSQPALSSINTMQAVTEKPRRLSVSVKTRLLRSFWYIALLSIHFPIHAEWNPAVVLQNHCKISDLQDPQYAMLKTQVMQELKDSWCSPEKIDLLMDLTLLTRPKLCVEIGACTGSSVLPVAAILQYLNSGKIFAIDAWSNTEAIRYLTENDPNKTWWSQVNMGWLHNAYQHLIHKWSLTQFCTEICKPSYQAIYDIPTDIDFLHIDGDFSETGSLQDVELYLPKVKTGGYILLSNFYLMINREQPKIKAFVRLCDQCEPIASIERDNAILFQKN